jgi:hypothetical protein
LRDSSDFENSKANKIKTSLTYLLSPGEEVGVNVVEVLFVHHA